VNGLEECTYLDQRNVQLVEIDFLLPEQLLVRGQFDDEIGHEVPDPCALRVIYSPPPMLDDIFQYLHAATLLRNLD